MSGEKLNISINLTLDATRASASAVPPLPTAPLSVSQTPQHTEETKPETLRYITKRGPGNMVSRYDRETQQWS